MYNDKELKIHCLEIFGASSSCNSGAEAIGSAMNAHDWIMRQGNFAPKESKPDSSKANGKEAHIQMNIGGVPDSGVFRGSSTIHKRQSDPDSNVGCEASKPEESAKDDGEITAELHIFPANTDLSHILHELLGKQPKKSKDPQFPDLLSALPKERREAIKKDMQAFVDSL